MCRESQSVNPVKVTPPRRNFAKGRGGGRIVKEEKEGGCGWQEGGSTGSSETTLPSFAKEELNNRNNEMNQTLEG